MAVAASLALTALFSAVAAIGFSGRSNGSSAGAPLDASTSASGGSASGQRVALPPTDGGSLTAPLAPPISQPVVPPPVTSGGS